MSDGIWTYFIPIAVNLGMAIGARALGWLTFGGTVSAFLIGFLAFRFTGIGGWSLLMLFFITANILGKLGRSISRTIVDSIQKKGGCRDWVQVIANGGLAGAAALLYGFGGGTLALVMFGSAIAASTADTWAGEVGILSKKPPLSIRTFKPIPTGMSGGVSWLGTVSGLFGSALIALAWYGAFADSSDSSWMFLASIVAVAGMTGSLADSLLGATVQGHYWDPQHGQVTERDQQDGVKFELCRGIRWIDNDVVNFLSNVVAVLIGSGLSMIVG